MVEIDIQAEQEALDREPWDRIKDEPDEAWHCFTAYRDMGLDRSIDKAYVIVKNEGRHGAKPTRRAPSTWWTRSVRWHWTARCRAFDAHIERIARAGREAELVAQVQAHSEAERQGGVLLRQIGIRMSQVALSHLNRPEINPNEGEPAGMATMGNQGFSGYVRVAKECILDGLAKSSEALSISEMVETMHQSQGNT